MPVTHPPGSGGSGGVTDHGDLTGLTPDDDHPQYALADGSRGDFEPTGTAAAAVAAHDADTTDVHGIADTADLVVTADLDAEAAAREAADALLIPLTQKASANGVATLGADSKIPSAQLPAVAVNDFLGTVASEAAMLALTGERGDIAIRTDFDPDRTFMIVGDDPSELADWTWIGSFGGVESVDGAAGVVVLESDGDPGTATKRSLGTGAQQAAAGNDARLSDTRTPTDDSVSTAKIQDGAVTPEKLSFVPGGVSVLDRVVATTTRANSSSEETLYSFSVPGNTLTAGKALRLTVFGDYFNNSGAARTITLRIKLGATTVLAAASPSLAAATPGRRKWAFEVLLVGETTSAQRAGVSGAFGTPTSDTWEFGGTGGSSIHNLVGYGTAAEDAAAAKTLAFTAQHSNANASLDIRLHGALLELL